MRKISGICALFAILLAALPAKAGDYPLAVGDNSLPENAAYTWKFTPSSNGTLIIEFQDAWSLPDATYNGKTFSFIQDDDNKIKYPYRFIIGEVEAGKDVSIVDNMGRWPGGCYVDFTSTGGPAPTPEPWTFASVSPAEGEVTSLSSITLTFGDDLSGSGTKEGTITGTFTTPTGSEDFIFGSDIFITSVSKYFDEITAPGTYTLTFAAGAAQNQDGVNNAAMTYTWTIPTPEPPAGDDTECEFGEVTVTTTDNTKFVISFDDLDNVDFGEGNSTFDGAAIAFGIDFTLPFNCVTFTLSSAASAGEHTIVIPAGALLDDFGGEPNAKDIKIVFTIAGSDPTPGGNGTSEVFFEAGDLGTSTITDGTVAIDGENASMATEGKPFLDSYLYVNYNSNDEKELNWTNGTKLIFTSKTDVITSIVFTPTNDSKSSIPYASADKGSYDNGVWTGSLAAGETLTLTSNDGINITKITINCNGGAADDDDDDDDEEPSVEIISPVDGDVISQIGYASKFIHVKTNTQFAQFYWMVINDDDPNNMLSSYYDGGNYAIVAGDDISWEIVPPAEKAWSFYKGETYKVVVYAYLNTWDSQSGNVAAADSIYITGNGIDREVLSTVELKSISPTPRTSLDGLDVTPSTIENGADATITVQFDGAVSSLSAVIPGGMSGSNTNLTTTKADATGTKWTITLPADQMTNDTYPFDFTFNITAKDANGLNLDLDPSHSDHTLDITFSISESTGSDDPDDDDPSGDDPSGDDEPDYGTVVGSATTEFGAVTVSTKDNTIFYVTFKDQQGVFGGTGATIDDNAATASKDGIDDTVTNIIVVKADAAIADGDHTLTFPAGKLSDWNSVTNAADIVIPFTIGEGGGEDPDDDEPTSKIIVLYEVGVNADENPCTSITKDGVTLNIAYTGSASMAQYFQPFIGTRGAIQGLHFFNPTQLSFQCSTKIEKIEFVGTSITGISDITDNVWAGTPSTEISFISKVANVDITKITVYLEGWDDAEETTVPFTMTSAGWGTLILPFEAEIPTGLTAYSTNSYNDSDILTLSEATSLEANTPYIMAGTAGSYEFKGVAANTQSSYTNGLLTGVFADTDINSGYVMQMQGDDVAFFLVNTTVTVPAYHCYISAKSSSTIFRFGDVTAIENALQTISSEPIYDLSGRQVEGTLKQGIYIQGGKKFFVK